ncbi:MAG TPA: DUF5765 domain-containing protein [Polyangiaceae bacterium]|jgi:uncharacterized membrane protein YuzA (DUF378 family)|nr:MAG: hypothetical protein BWY17_05137 [Deltaproteobacteria bacterium ADurb.Bin207]HNS96819.1 DUF5765 domain-containing protein [Polyangiaceae bacterium]HNZ23287.1 DUF5765 domain-containing protein [Polyangiaceae bacterium]HOD21943.1 DUF5765 domain-containing protein [Polyangiaceae bacterium]HOE51840.1 DUF5765 domain-containing protein [Polyangiaceae bacterium]
MCWSGEASAAIALGGLTSAYILKRKGEPKEIYIPTAYFVLMEGLQALTYIVVGECGTRFNTLFTHLAMVHISFQPIFINMLGMEFVDPGVKRRIKKYVYAFCGLVAVFCLMRLIPAYELLGRCETGGPLCSHVQTCAYRGQWHIGWDVLLNGFNERWRWYVVSAFALPVLYGSWKWSLYHYVVGPLAASLTTSDVNERPAVWCLFSTCIIALLVNTRLRNYIHVRKWFTWKYLLARTPTRMASVD